MESGSDGGALDGAERHSDSWHEPAQGARGDGSAQSSADGHSVLGEHSGEQSEHSKANQTAAIGRHGLGLVLALRREAIHDDRWIRARL
jgi:hypothetical protein